MMHGHPDYRFVMVEDFGYTNSYAPKLSAGDHQIMVLVCITPDSKVHGAIIGPIWGRQDPGGPHVGPMNFAIWNLYDAIITWTHCLYNWPFVKRIHWWRMDYPHKSPVMRSFDVFFVVSLNEVWNIES